MHSGQKLTFYSPLPGPPETQTHTQAMSIVRLTPAGLAQSLHLVLPRSWKGKEFVDWRGGRPLPAESGDIGEGRCRIAPPKAWWLALFWSEMSMLDADTAAALKQWPLLPVTTGELVSCSMLQQVPE